MSMFIPEFVVNLPLGFHPRKVEIYSVILSVVIFCTQFIRLFGGVRVNCAFAKSLR